MPLLNTYSLCNFNTSYSNAKLNGRTKALGKESPPASSKPLLLDLDFSVTNNVFVSKLSLHPFYQRTRDLPGFIYEISGLSRNSFNRFNSSSLSSSFFFPLFSWKSKRTQNLLAISCSTFPHFSGLFERYFSTFFSSFCFVELYLNALDSLDVLAIVV